MASLNLNVGTAANANDGATLRDAVINVRKMFADIYGITYSSDTQNISGTTLAIKAAQLSNTITPASGNDGYVLTYDHSSGGFTLEQKFDGDITGIVAGNGLTGDATSGDATLNVVGGDGITANANEIEVAVDDSTIELSATSGSGTVRIKDLGVATGKIAADAVNGDKIADDSINSEHYVDGSIDTAHIADLQVTTAKIAADSITNAKLGVEYTASSALTSGTAVAVDTSLGDVFTMTAAHSHTFNFTNVVVGDVKTLEITGSGGSLTSAFGTSNGASATFNKIGGTYSDAAAKQIIQIKWTAVNNAWYQISQIAS